MLKLSCNVSDQFQIPSQAHCRFLDPPRPISSLRRRNASLPFSKTRPLLQVQAVVSDQGSSRVESASGSLADRLRLGSLTPDGLSYKEKFIVRCYEVGINKTATVETIANLLQEVGCNHAQNVGFSTDGFATTTTMRKLHLIWVTARMHIEVYKYPAWSDVVEIETWCQSEGRIGTRRDWILKDYATGQVIGRATSKWVMMNQDTRRLQKVSDDVRDEYLVFCPRELRLAFPEENNSSLRKISKLEDPAQYSRLGLMPRRADFDMNQHVNNVAYIGWVLESMPQDIIDTHELQTITLDYRRECQQDDIVDSLTSLEPVDDTEAVPKLRGTNGFPAAIGKIQDQRQFLHLLRLSSDGSEINRGRTEWRKKPELGHQDIPLKWQNANAHFRSNSAINELLKEQEMWEGKMTSTIPSISFLVGHLVLYCSSLGFSTCLFSLLSLIIMLGTKIRLKEVVVPATRIHDYIVLVRLRI